MKLLALDSSTEACSVALQVDEQVTERHAVEARAHTRLLLPMVTELLDAAGLAAGDLDAVILGNGPGSFIGLRIAASVAQGLCFASGVALVPVSSLAAVAAEALLSPGCERVLVAQDAHMHEVYLGGFAAGSGATPCELRAPALQRVGRIDGLTGTWHAAGAGWNRYPELLAANGQWLAGRVAPDWPRARCLLAPGRERLLAGGAVDPERLEPEYLREQVATPPVQ